MFRSRTAPARPLDALKNPERWQDYIRRHPALIERLTDTEEGMMVTLRRAVEARAQGRVPLFAAPPPALGVEGRPNSIGRTLHDVEVYAEMGDLLPEVFDE